MAVVLKTRSAAEGGGADPAPFVRASELPGFHSEVQWGQGELGHLVCWCCTSHPCVLCAVAVGMACPKSSRILVMSLAFNLVWGQEEGKAAIVYSKPTPFRLRDPF